MEAMVLLVLLVIFVGNPVQALASAKGSGGGSGSGEGTLEGGGSGSVDRAEALCAGNWNGLHGSNYTTQLCLLNPPCSRPGFLTRSATSGVEVWQPYSCNENNATPVWVTAYPLAVIEMDDDASTVTATIEFTSLHNDLDVEGKSYEGVVVAPFWKGEWEGNLINRVWVPEMDVLKAINYQENTESRAEQIIDGSPLLFELTSPELVENIAMVTNGETHSVVYSWTRTYTVRQDAFDM